MEPGDTLEETIIRVVNLANEMGLKSLNESDTKSALIEPVLESLGWNTRDPRVVKREYSTMAGKYADYALLVEKEPRLFVEAKDAGKNLFDDKWTAQVVSYANTEGVDWCVLTDGLVWRLFKANEPVRVNEKLAFEVDLADIHTNSKEILTRLAALTPTSVSKGELHKLGTQIFIDSKVKEALTNILTSKDQGLVNLIKKNVNVDVKPAEIRGSLTRILDGFSMSGANIEIDNTSIDTTLQPQPVTMECTQKPTNNPHTRDTHPKLNSTPTRELFDLLQTQLLTLRPTVTEIYQKRYVSYKAKHSLLTVVPLARKLVIYINIPYSQVTDPKQLCRNVTNKGHWGVGDTEIHCNTPEDVNYIVTLAEQALALQK